jgi:thiosulfate dehydrogenase [quinone] large subunit
MASILTACGGGGSGQTTSESGSGKSTTQGTGPEIGRGDVIAETSEVPTDSAKAFTDADSGQPAVLVHLQSGDFVAYSAVCTHQGCTVSYQPQSQKLACPCHGSVFDPARGAAVETGPAKTPLPEIGVAVQSGEIVRS